MEAELDQDFAAITDDIDEAEQMRLLTLKRELMRRREEYIRRDAELADEARGIRRTYGMEAVVRDWRSFFDVYRESPAAIRAPEVLVNEAAMFFQIGQPVDRTLGIGKPGNVPDVAEVAKAQFCRGISDWPLRNLIRSLHTHFGAWFGPLRVKWGLIATSYEQARRGAGPSEVGAVLTAAYPIRRSRNRDEAHPLIRSAL
eukprot:gene34230-40039_t